LEDGQESGGFVSLLNANVRAALFIQLDRFEGRGALVGGRSLGAVPDEVAEAIAAQKAVNGRLALQVLARDSYPILPADDVRVPRVKLPARHLIQQDLLVIGQVPHFDAQRRDLIAIQSKCQSIHFKFQIFPANLFF
jgi:hypothetical protein